RNKQTAYNKKNRITPKGVQKAINDIMEGGYSGAPGSPKRYARLAEEYRKYAELSPTALSKKIKELEDQMYRHAENLEFEEAARLRDEARRLREASLELPRFGRPPAPRRRKAS
ncbi:MAG: UvrB/UvrC motif-containing protein, partial [Gammaproteobacteria bacterium]|nr:UvrB/UvrC motif-containing protein [Gammaproteobacteria bacterium]